MALVFDSTLADVILLIAVLLIAFHLYSSHVYLYWKRRGVFYVEPTYVFGNMKEVALQREHMSLCLQHIYDASVGRPYVGLFFGMKPMLMVRDLELLRSIFVKDAHVFLDRDEAFPKSDDLFARSLFALVGKHWRWLRIKLTPTFTSGRIKRMYHLINECGKQLVPCIEQEVLKGDAVGVKDVTARYATDVIASCAFGVNANALADPDCEFRMYTKKMLEFSLANKMIYFVFLVMPAVARLLKVRIMDSNAYDFVRRTFWYVVDYRKKNKLVRDDFVDLLLQIKQEGQVQAQDVNDLNEIEQDSKYMNTISKTEKSDIVLEDDDILAQAFIFLLAGFETSSSVITYALYELALHPDIQQRLRQEIQAVLRKHSNEVTYDVITEMTYLDMVVSETMRMYPTLPHLERMCLSDYTIEGTNLVIEKGIKIIIPVKSIHYNPDIYPEPHKFDPERFSSENKRKLPHFAHLPFGEGPRICIGMRFGQMQVKTALVHVVTSYQVRPCLDTPEPPLIPKPGSDLLIPKQDIVLAFTKLRPTSGE